jgi:hypothetical protein
MADGDEDAREDAEPVLGRKPAIPRLAATACVVGSVVAGVAGLLVYQAHAGDVPIVPVELGGADQPLPLPAGTRSALGWDAVLIAGYGTALTLAAVLARTLFRTPEARNVARALAPLTVVAVLADVVEDLLLLLATDRGQPGELLGIHLLDLVAAAAVLKFSCLLPALVIAVVAVAVASGRLVWHRKGRLARRGHVEVQPPDPLEGDPAAARHADGEAGAARWRRGYRVPDVDLGPASRGQPVLGFCLSGGGIRSASVALGALQSLRPELLRARYLVSVSGGGYTAGALQLALTDGLDPEHPPHGTVSRDPASTYLPGSVEEDRLRRHASYIADSPARIVVALGVVCRVLLLSLAVLFAPAVVLGAAVGELYRGLPLAPLSTPGDPSSRPEILAGTVVVLVVLALVALLGHLAALARLAYSTGSARLARSVANGATALGLLVALVGLGVPQLVHLAGLLLHQTSTSTVAVGGPVAGVVLTYIATLGTFLRRKKVRDKVGGLFKRKSGSTVGAVPGGALQLLLVVASLVVLAAGWLLLVGGVAWEGRLDGARTATLGSAAGVAAVLLVLGGVLDQTALSLHSFYRRRLAGAFAARRVLREDAHVVAEGYSFGEWTSLPVYGRRPEGFPEVVFSATANLTGEQRAPMNASSFTFTADWLGGPDVGYVRTSDLLRVVRPPFRRDLTVEAAVAVSGAAIASSIGRAARWYTTLLAVTGARLGTWLPNPAFLERWNDARTADDWAMPGLPRLRRLSYLVREVLGIHRWTDRLLQITDGGHYENLGLVEALRRRCTEIYVIDASGDNPPTAGAFEEAISLAYAELGVRVVLDEHAWHLVPGSAEPLGPTGPLSALNARLSQEDVVTASLCYPPESGLPEGQRHGVLVFAKALLTPGLPYDLLSYASRHAVFPHDSTGDQFFGDVKFTAYAALGRQLGHDAACAMTAARTAGRAQTPCPPEGLCPQAVPVPVPPPAAPCRCGWWRCLWCCCE